PNGTPTVLGDQLLERHAELVGGLERALDVLRAEHLLSYAETLLAQFFVHGSSAKGEREQRALPHERGIVWSAASDRQCGLTCGRRESYDVTQSFNLTFRTPTGARPAPVARPLPAASNARVSHYPSPVRMVDRRPDVPSWRKMTWHAANPSASE